MHVWGVPYLPERWRCRSTTTGLRGPYRRPDGIAVDQVLTPEGWLGRTHRRVSRDILDEFEQQRGAPVYRRRRHDVGEVVEDRASGFCGGIVAFTAEAVTLRDRQSRTRLFRYKPGGFLSTASR